MSTLHTFEAFPKIPRLRRDIVVTEKIDGTNAQVVVTEDGQVLAGSRTRLITLGKQTDNYGFAQWVKDHEDELRACLGVGRHFGEWWGAGINRGYRCTCMNDGARRFSLFNTDRWPPEGVGPCSVVPVLYKGPWSDEAIKECLSNLEVFGSVAAPGFTRPEGVMVFHRASSSMYKVLLENDELPKGLVTHGEKRAAEHDPR